MVNDIHMAVTVSLYLRCKVTFRSLVYRYRRFRESCCLHFYYTFCTF